MQNKISNLPHKKLRHLLSTPFILGMSLPLVLLDVCIEIYHHIAFPLYGIAINKRKNYIKIDRPKLSYLSTTDKIWCAYCGYANGLLAYSVKIAGDTEAYWCGIKHKESKDFVPQPHQKDFLPYGDEKAYNDFVNERNNNCHK